MQRCVALAIAIACAGCGRWGFDDLEPVTYRDAVLSDRPAGYWRLGDGGAIAYDETGTSDVPYAGNCDSQVAGALVDDVDRATAFDAATCHLALALDGRFEFLGTAAFSIELWLATPQIQFTQYIVMKETRSPSHPIDGYAIVIDVEGIYAERTIDGALRVTPRTPIGSAFVHVVFVYDGAELRLHIDATSIERTDDPRALVTNPATLEIGGLPGIGGWVDGVIDELAIYDHALTLERIAVHHDLGVNGPH